MPSYNQKATPFVSNNHISVQVADEYSGYSLQYLRRLLRDGKLGGIKIGQLWLVDKGALDFVSQDLTCLIALSPNGS